MLHAIKNKTSKWLWGWTSLMLFGVPFLVGAQGWATGRANVVSANLPGGSIYDIIRQTMNWILAILGFIAIISFVIAGILYLTSAGDEGRAEQAKNAMKYAIIGVIVALMGFVIIKAIDAWLMAPVIPAF